MLLHASDAGCISTTSDASIAVPCYLLANMLSPRDSSGDGKHHQIEKELVAVFSFSACAGPRTRNSLSDYITSFPWCISMRTEDLAFLAVLYGYYLVLSSSCFSHHCRPYVLWSCLWRYFVARAVSI